jgi:DNA uptake protein ComE-like DNA-binding protein
MQSHWQSYFVFSKNERIALVSFMVLMSVFLTAPYWYHLIVPLSKEQKAIRFQLTHFVADSLVPTSSETFITAETEGDYNRNNIVLHAFNPNHLKEEDWISMGLPAKTARTIQRYISKGGRFRQPNDLRKIWGISESDVERLLPYIRLEKPASIYPHMQTSNTSPIKYSAIDINGADSAAWASLPGIGKVLSKRIIHYRERLGGFRSVEDLRHVYGLADSVYSKLLPYLRLPVAEKGKPNLNTLSAQRLSQIGGIDSEIAQAIVVYRQQNGPFKNFNGLRQLVFINDSLLTILGNRVQIQ